MPVQCSLNIPTPKLSQECSIQLFIEVSKISISLYTRAKIIIVSDQKTSGRSRSICLVKLNSWGHNVALITFDAFYIKIKIN